MGLLLSGMACAGMGHRGSQLLRKWKRVLVSNNCGEGDETGTLSVADWKEALKELGRKCGRALGSARLHPI
jgi:hypothetical protein